MSAAGCTKATDSLDCLRHVPYTKLNAILNTTEFSGAWNPVVDGDFIQRYASIQLSEGDFVKVPVIDGANTDEGTAFGPAPVQNTQQFVGWITNSTEGPNLPSAFASGVLSAYPDEPGYFIPPVAEIGNYQYPPSYGAQYRRSAGYFGDAVMIANRRGTCQTWAAHGLDAFCYRFNTIPNGIPFTTGVTHFQEVAFVFDNTNGYGYNAAHDSVNPFGGKPKSYTELAKLMSCSWASFIHDLNPNGFKTRHSDAAAWPKYSVQDPKNIVWDANATSLAYTEPDTFRKAGIQWILDHALAYRR